ncbi:hypothetical protein ROJ8625_00743 [Roseivivax jejudonensis]|uniref:Uncharacterized protein n=1 Tax=Roseivivax jejudonensis TaxID=1529041 RepID=A0A1X6YG85_9RHOB|nr:hypothetical protein [Roseivivax jejudonensis]SLN20531.1 hypothetical protein ROJ8625_00743 [Roseivivax jejudonensis]
MRFLLALILAAAATLSTPALAGGTFPELPFLEFPPDDGPFGPVDPTPAPDTSRLG